MSCHLFGSHTYKIIYLYRFLLLDDILNWGRWAKSWYEKSKSWHSNKEKSDENFLIWFRRRGKKKEINMSKVGTRSTLVMVFMKTSYHNL